MEELEEILTAVAARLDGALKQQLLQGGHVRSGKLLASIGTEVVRTASGFELHTHMEDYGPILNRQIGFIEAGLAQTEPLLKELSREAVWNIVRQQI